MSPPDAGLMREATDVDIAESTEVTAASGSVGSPSVAFLRELAHVSDQLPQAPPIASVLGERFELRRRLGAGGFGIVYEAFDRTRQAVVALKLMRPRDPGALLRFKREFRALAEIAHPNLAQLYELCSDGEAWWFTMELVDGTDAASFARTPGEPLDVGRVRHVFRGLAEGLAFLHGARKLHRDVKPSNVMVARDRRVVLLDFGLVADVNASEAIEVAGTRPYMAPESQSGGAPTMAASDWFSVGVMLYELLTGQLPFTGDDGEMLARKRAGSPPRPSSVAAGVPSDLDRLCLDLLAADPSERPEGPEVIARLSTSAVARDAVRLRDIPFVGRARELSALEHALGRARAGRTIVALVRGPSGTGKSALIQRYADGIDDSSALVLAGRCLARESVPYKAVDGLVDALCKRLQELPVEVAAKLLPPDAAILARIFPVLRQLAAVRRAVVNDDGDDMVRMRQRAFGALRSILARLGETKTPVILIDDVQWSDPDGVALLLDLLRPPVPILAVLTYRTEDVATSATLSALLTGLGDAAGVELQETELGDLDADASEQLACAWLGVDIGDPRARMIAKAAHNNPFFVTELCHSAEAAAIGDLAELLEQRVERLPRAAQRLLEVVALATRPLPRRIAMTAAFAGDEPQILAMLHANRLVMTRPAPGGEDLSPYHERIRDVVASRLSEEDRAERHLGIARALERGAVAEAEELFSHYRAAGASLEAARCARAAALQAKEALAFERATRLYREALALGSWDPQTRSELLAGLGEVLAAQGRPREAAEAYLEASEVGPSSRALEHRRRAMEQLMLGGYTEDGLVVLDRVLREVGLTRDPVRTIASLALGRAAIALRGLEPGDGPPRALTEQEVLRIDTYWAAAMGLMMRNPSQAADFHTRHLLLALDTAEPRRLSRALSLEAFYQGFRGDDPEQNQRQIERAMTLATLSGRPYEIALARLAAGTSAVFAGDVAEAVTHLRASERVFRGCGLEAPLERDLTQQVLTSCLFRAGELREFRETVETLLEEARARGNRWCESMVRIIGAALVELMMDRPERAEAHVDDATRSRSVSTFSFHDFRALQIRAWIALYRGDPGAVLRLFARNHPAVLTSGLLRSRGLRIELTQCRVVASISAATSRFSPSLLLAARDVAMLESERSPFARAIGGALRAHLLARSGRRDEAIDHLARAEASLREAGTLLLAVAAERRRGEWLGHAGRSLRESADAWMTAAGIVNPARMTSALLGQPSLSIP